MLLAEESFLNNCKRQSRVSSQIEQKVRCSTAALELQVAGLTFQPRASIGVVGI